MFEPMPHAGDLAKIEIIALCDELGISFITRHSQHTKVDHQRLLNGLE
jgi:hypothetical protein